MFYDMKNVLMMYNVFNIVLLIYLCIKWLIVYYLIKKDENIYNRFLCVFLIWICGFYFILIVYEFNISSLIYYNYV